MKVIVCRRYFIFLSIGLMDALQTLDLCFRMPIICPDKGLTCLQTETSHMFLKYFQISPADITSSVT